MRPPEEIKFVAQPPRSKLCGACVCAMATGQTLEQVLSETDWRKFTSVAGVAEYLARRAILMGVAVIHLERMDGELELIESFHVQVPVDKMYGLLCVKSPRMGEGGMHWAFWNGHFVLDPLDPDGNYKGKHEVTEFWPLVYLTDPDPMPEWARDLPERWEDSLL
jgi:hypothetical protein